MATPKPGEIRCPTCHRSTPPAAFCTQCGSAIPSDARIRPRGMDRDELQGRIRARRSDAEPYRRGGMADEGSSGYRRFEPEPEDAQARRAQRPDERRRDAFDEVAAGAGAGAAAAPPDRPDITRDEEDWTQRPSLVPPIAPRPEFTTPEPQPADEPAHVDHYDDAAYDEAGYAYEYDEWDESPQRRSSGAGAFAILGFLALGVLALLGGAVLAGVFSGDPNVGGGDPTHTPSPSVGETSAASEAASASPSADASAGPPSSLEPNASGDPIVFDDGASFEVQACASNEMSFDGCAQEAEFLSGGAFVAWVGFSDAAANDTLILVLRQDGAAVADSEFVLADPPFSCTAASPCTGYARQGFTGLPPGEYTVELLRNGEPAHVIRIGVD
jgi:hypothetical protein